MQRHEVFAQLDPDLYAARVVEILKSRHPEAQFFGCAGPLMQAQGVDPVVDSRSLSVLGLVEVIRHIPRIRKEMQKLMQAAADRGHRLCPIGVIGDLQGPKLRIGTFAQGPVILRQDQAFRLDLSPTPERLPHQLAPAIR